MTVRNKSNRQASALIVFPYLVPLAALRTVPAALDVLKTIPSVKAVTVAVICRLDSSSVFFGLCAVALAMILTASAKQFLDELIEWLEAKHLRD